MPKYKKKITRLMNYDEFKHKIAPLPIARQALLTLLFLAGCRISEALALTSDDIHRGRDLIYVQFFRLKGSKQTDPQQLPRVRPLEWLCDQEGNLFTFSRSTAYRTVKKAFPLLYPHYFRMNRITKTLERFGVPAVTHSYGLSLSSIELIVLSPSFH
jgi:integrase